MPAWQVLVDAVGLIPVVGALKNVDEVAALVKAFRQGENLLGNLGDGARAGSRLALAGAGAAENAGTLNRVSESFDAAANTARGGQRLMETGANNARMAEDVFHLQPQVALDEDWYKKYNAARERYAAAAADSGTADTVTYYRVQTKAENSVPGNRSFERILVNEDGTIALTRPNRNVNVSAYNMEHANYYAESRRNRDSYIVAFEVPRGFDAELRENAILQDFARNNPLNQGRTAPKMVDISQAGFSYELPPIWSQRMVTYATNARIIPFGGG